MKRLDQLTFTRFVAILIVLFFHGGGGIYLQAINIYPLSPILISATTSVTYLFVLSGFVMSLVYIRPNEGFKIDKYWTARFVRLYPLYLISFLLVCYYYIDFVGRVKPQKTLANVLVIQAWIPRYAQSFNYAAWSMTVEFFFYALFPFMALWAYRQSTRKLIWLSIIAYAVSQLVHNALWIGYFPDYENFLVYFPPFHLSSFLLGAAGGVWYLREGSGQKVRTRTTLLVFAVGIFLVSLYTVISSRSLNLPNGIQLMTGLLAPMLTIVIVALAMDKSRFSIFLKNPKLVTLGDTSYGLYILHVPAMWIYLRALENSSLTNPQQIFDYTFLPLMIAFVLLLHFFIDQPLRVWLKKIFEQVSIPLVLLNLVILTISVYLSFRLRIGFGREFIPYRNFALVMFWSAFILRTVLSVGFDALNPRTLSGTMAQFVRPVLFSVTAGSVVLVLIGYFGYRFGWFENFPRSIFLTDWVIMLVLSLSTRYLIRRADIYSSQTKSI